MNASAAPRTSSWRSSARRSTGRWPSRGQSLACSHCPAMATPSTRSRVSRDLVSPSMIASSHGSMSTPDDAEGRRRPSGILTSTRNTPIEALGTSVPVAGAPAPATAGLRRCRLRARRRGDRARPSGARGRDGVADHGATRLAGGEPGAVGENRLLPGGDEARAERLPDKCTIQLKAGDVVRMLTPGGGGWGVPASHGSPPLSGSSD